jgi:hypothetical protein
MNLPANDSDLLSSPAFALALGNGSVPGMPLDEEGGNCRFEGIPQSDVRFSPTAFLFPG